MPASPDLAVPSTAPPATTLACFGRPPLVPGDDTADYEALQAALSEALRPRDVIEQAWVREAGDLLWEKLALRRRKAALMTACAGEGLRELLNGLNVSDFFFLSRRWAARELEAVGRVDAILNAAGLGMEHVMARTLRQIIGETERIERMIASIEVRRAATLREIAQYRTAFGADLHRVVRQVETVVETVHDAEFAVIAPALPQPSGPEPAETAA